MKLSMTKDQAKEFIKLQELGDNLALEYYYNLIKTVSIDTNFEMSIIRAARYLNNAIIAMEMGWAKHNGNIDTAYREIMMELVESARKICEYEV